MTACAAPFPSRLRTAFAATLASVLLAACVTTPVGTQPSAAQTLAEAQSALRVGIAQYEQGDYDASSRALREALRLGLLPEDAVSAHKHLAFILCTSERPLACGNAFREALRIDPAFDLTRAEAGHPMWGPVFHDVKQEITGR